MNKQINKYVETVYLNSASRLYLWRTKII